MLLGSRTALRRSLAPAAALVLLLGVSGCSGDDSDTTTPEASASATPGAEVSAEAATFSAPSGFSLAETDSGKGGNNDSKPSAVQATGTPGNALSFVAVDAPSSEASLQTQGEAAAKGLGSKFSVEDTVEVDGVEMWHVSGKEGQGRFLDAYGAIVDGQAVRLTVRLNGDDYNDDQRAAATQQILDSWSWSDVTS